MECFFKDFLRNTKRKIKKANSIIKYHKMMQMVVKLKNKKQKPESFFKSFLPLTKTLVAAFNEMCAHASSKNDAEQGIIMPNLLQNFKLFGRTPPFLLQKSTLKILIFRILLLLKEALVVTFNEKRAPTSRKYIAEQDIIISNLLQFFQFFWQDSSVFAL